MKIGIPICKSKSQYYINQAYVDYVAEAGLEPVMIAPINDMKTMAQICDGLLLPGGIDLEPTFYGEDNIGSMGADPEKDDFERKALFTFTAAGKPVFGICRGFQLIVRELLLKEPKFDEVLDFYQNVNNHSLSSDLDAARSTPTHAVEIDSGLYNHKKGGKHTRMFVNSMHHQALIAPALAQKGNFTILGELEILAYTRRGLPKQVKKDNDGKGVIIEAFKLKTFLGGKIMGVQWHPEELKDVQLIRGWFESHTKHPVKQPVKAAKPDKHALPERPRP